MGPTLGLGTFVLLYLLKSPMAWFLSPPTVGD